MDFDELDEMAGDPRFIPGIYNFCDRWCERCPFTSRCLTFASGEKLEEELERRRSEEDNAAFWERLDTRADEAADSVAGLAGDDEEPWDDDEEEFQEYLREEERRDEEARNHPAARAAHLYMGMVDAWLEQHDAAVEAKLKQIAAPPPAEPGAPDPGEEAALLQDAVEVIGWYQHQVWVKLMRALHRNPLVDAIWDDEEWEDDEEEEPLYLPKDSDVSAKIALIGMDRSLAAWGDVRNILPSTADSVARMLVHLVRLRRLVEEEFPDARGIVRPGFDTPLPPIKDER